MLEPPGRSKRHSVLTALAAVIVFAAVAIVLVIGTIWGAFGHLGPSTSTVWESGRPYAQGIVGFERAHGRLPVLLSRDWPRPAAGPIVHGSASVGAAPPMLRKLTRFVTWTQRRGWIDLDTRLVETGPRGTVVAYVPRATFRTGNGRYHGYALRVIDFRGKSGLYGRLLTICTVWGDPIHEHCSVDTPESSLPVPVLLGPGPR